MWIFPEGTRLQGRGSDGNFWILKKDWLEDCGESPGCPVVSGSHYRYC